MYLWCHARHVDFMLERKDRLSHWQNEQSRLTRFLQDRDWNWYR